VVQCSHLIWTKRPPKHRAIAQEPVRPGAMGHRHFSEKEAQELAAKVTKTHGGSTTVRTAAPKPPTGGTLRLPAEKKCTLMGSTSNQHTPNQPADDKKKGATDKEVAVDPNDANKKLRLSMEVDSK
jgi:hypothetical protein